MGFGKEYLISILVICLCLATGATGSAQEVMAVISSDLKPYLEAFEGFGEAFGRPVPFVNLEKEGLRVGPGVHVVVAFGGKAALEHYPDQATLVYCMAPGIRLRPADRKGPLVRVQMLPRPGSALVKLKEIQPGLRRLEVLWTSDGIEDYLQEMQQVSPSLGVEVLVERLNGPDDLPDRLRALVGGRVDALWLSPDPLLVNSQSFSILREFSWSNDIPFYAPTAGLVEKGAVASVSTSFREIGRTAAMAVQRALAGTLSQGEVYPERSEVIVNMTAAANAGLRIPPEVSQKADRVLP